MRVFLFTICILSAAVGPVAAQFIDGGDPPFIATPEQVVDLMLDLAGVGDGDLVYDLGSGDGRMVIAAAERGARGIGVEYDADLVRLSQELARQRGVTELTEFVHADIFETAFGDADVVMLYLGAAFNRRLRPRLLETLRPGARVVSHAFHMDDWEPDDVVTIGNGAGRATVYLWHVPVDVDGFWSLDAAGRTPLTVEIDQRYQELNGMAWEGDVEFAVEGTVRGEELELVLVPLSEGAADRVAFSGRFVGGRLAGRLSDSAGSGTAAGVRFSDPSRAPL